MTTGVGWNRHDMIRVCALRVQRFSASDSVPWNLYRAWARRTGTYAFGVTLTDRAKPKLTTTKTFSVTVS